MSDHIAKEPRQFARENRPENAQEQEGHEKMDGIFFASGPDSNALADEGMPSRETDQTRQLKSIQAAANNSPQVQLMRQNQAAANASPQVQAAVQRKQSLEQAQPASQRKENKTGLPDELKSGIESLGGYSMDDVKVHYNSDMPAQMQAHAFAQGTDIHIAPGQEQHLAHEAWHVVQQKQGRVQARTQLKGIGINDDTNLEKEADLMGAKAMQMNAGEENNVQLNKKAAASKEVGQLKKYGYSNGKLKNSNTVDVWLSKDTSRKGHLFEVAVGHAETKEALIKKVTEMVAKEGTEVTIRVNDWVGPDDAYNNDQMTKIDPYRLRISGTHGEAREEYVIEAHFGPYHHGYIVNVSDGGNKSEIADRPRIAAANQGVTNDFSSRHHDTGDTNLLAESQKQVTDSRTKEQRLDASTKLIGEGARFKSVLNHQAELRDNSKFFVSLNSDNSELRWIKFSDLWLSWSATFNKAFEISDELVAERVKKAGMKKINNEGNGTDPIALGSGTPQDITVGSDYSLDDKTAAEQKHANIWHTFEVEIGYTKDKKPNRSNKGTVSAKIKGLDGVLHVELSGTGKKATVTSFANIGVPEIEQVLPDWAKKPVVPSPQSSEDVSEELAEDPKDKSGKEDAPTVVEPEPKKPQESKPAKKEVKPAKEKAKEEPKTPGLNEEALRGELNLSLGNMGVKKEAFKSQQISKLKSDFVQAAKDNTIGGTAFDKGKQEFRLTTAGSWEEVFRKFAEQTKVKVQVPEAAQTPEKSSQEEVTSEVEKEILSHGGQKVSAAVFTVFALALILFLVNWMMTGKLLPWDDKEL